MASAFKFSWYKVCLNKSTVMSLLILQADYWVLSIAVCTYLILASHKHQSSWIQEHKTVVWGIPWLLSILWASIGLGVVGYGDIGACKSALTLPRKASILITGRVLVHFRSRSAPRQLHSSLAYHRDHTKSLHQTVLHHPQGP
jgi:hypothetical protein